MTPYVPNCAVPLLFETDYEEAPYCMAGTGFLLQSSSKYFFLTAKHALNQGDHDRLRVPRSLDSAELLELGQFGHPILNPDEEDTDWADVVAFSVVPTAFGRDGDQMKLEPVILPNSDTRHLLVEGVILTVRGYPEAAPQSFIDFDRKRISMQALSCDARFVGITQSVACYELQFAESCPISDFNFMSGSPVFAKLPYVGDYLYVLVGVLLRAGGPERRGRFVSIEVFKLSRDRYANPALRDSSVATIDGSNSS